MNKERFELFQGAIEEDLLEEAVKYRRKTVNFRYAATLAACFCAVLAGVLVWHPWNNRKGSSGSAVYSAPATVMESTDTTDSAAAKAAGAVQENSMMDVFSAEMAEEEAPAEAEPEAYAADVMEEADRGPVSAGLVNPMHPRKMDELSQMGYGFTLPEGAEITWSGTIETADEQIAQVMFLYSGEEYTVRAAHGSEADISGVYDSAAAESNWLTDDLSVSLRKGAEGTVLLWYSEEKQTQWSLFGPSAEPDDVLLLAEGMASKEGWSVYFPQAEG